MAVQLILNDLSWPRSTAGIAQADNVIRKLVETVRESIRFGAERAVRVPVEFYASKVFNVLTVGQWVESLEDDVLQLFAKELFSVLQFLDPDSELSPEFDFEFKGTRAVGLGIAFVSGNVAISFDSAQIWSTTLVELQRHYLNDDTEEVEVDTISVPHVFNSDSVVDHKNLIAARASILPYSDKAAVISIEKCIEELPAVFRLQRACFSIGNDFSASARINNLFHETGLRHLLAESCARIVANVPKYDVNVWVGAELGPDWTACRTHLTKANSGYRLMFWKHKSGEIIFANVGPKFEELISYDVFPKSRC